MPHPQDLTVPPPDELFRLLVDSARDYAIFTTDPDGRILNWNPGAEHIFGWTGAEIVGRPLATIFTAEDRAQGAPEQERAQAAADGQTPDVRWHQRKDGTRSWARGVLTALRGADGALRGYGKILRDSTARRQIEEALAVSEERQRMALEGADIGTWHWDLAADVLVWSDRCKAIFGLPPDAAMSYEIFLDLLHTGDREATERAVVRALSGRTHYDIEYRVVWPDGGVHYRVRRAGATRWVVPLSFVRQRRLLWLPQDWRWGPKTAP